MITPRCISNLCKKLRASRIRVNETSFSEKRLSIREHEIEHTLIRKRKQKNQAILM
ncbi:hypothetical protein LEP1GSC036_3279 [Leptospira weilii str. 2006001853]|uniref:Uncharacterized protein n=1 Tax=Leptospira weilii str. 2006001853 TaxID=1001589 RepID=A0A828Z4S3_9LEPT|nr:hypothetical protein LEP1GSC036_3279 [Leptospira weilii str. 2006001853]